MKPIKVRAWDKSRNRMVMNITTIKIDRRNNVPCLIVYPDKKINPYKEIKEKDKVYCNEFKLMQSTGLKDKNNLEIYEGDVLFDKFSVLLSEGEFTIEIRGSVQIAKGMTYLIGKIWQDMNGEDLRISEYKALLLDPKIFKVMGNIFENPELFEVSK